MIDEAVGNEAGWCGRLLAIASIALFWLQPFSPILAIIALGATQRSTGWVRQAAVVGAFLSAVFTIAFAVLVFVVASAIPFTQ